jgi:acetyl-CoA acetyltransferase
MPQRRSISAHGNNAENVAKKYGITRGEKDEYALLSQQRAKAADLSGVCRQIVPSP